MNARERLFAALRGQPTDHVPVWLLFPYQPIGCYVDVRTHAGYRTVFEASKQYAIMLNRQRVGVPLFTPEVRPFREETTESDGTKVTRHGYEYRGQRVQAEWRRGREVTVRRLLTTAEDLEFFCSLPVLTEADPIRRELERQVPAYLEKRAEFPAEFGAMMLDLGEPIGPVYGSSDLGEYPVWSLTHDEVVVGFLDRLMQQVRQVYGFCLERDLADVYFLVGSELASPPMVSHGTFQRWIVPYARELIGAIRSHGKLSIQHYHGQIREVLPDFLTMAPDGLHTIEAPPTGNCTHRQAFDVVGKRLTLIGNIQYDEFRSLTTDGMKARVREVLDEARGERLILSPTAGPYDPDPPAQLFENYLAFMQAAWEHGPWTV